MAPTEDVLDHLYAQTQALNDHMESLDAWVQASSTPGIREYRSTRLRQLDDQRVALCDRLRRLMSNAEPAVEAHMLGSALRDAQWAAEGALGR